MNYILYIMNIACCSDEGDFKPGTRGYMSCTPAASPGYKKGAVTLVYINTNTENASVLMYLLYSISHVRVKS